MSIRRSTGFLAFQGTGALLPRALKGVTHVPGLLRHPCTRSAPTAMYLATTQFIVSFGGCLARWYSEDLAAWRLGGLGEPPSAVHFGITTTRHTPSMQSVTPLLQQSFTVVHESPTPSQESEVLSTH